MPIFEPELNTLVDFVNYYKDRLDKDCDDAVDFGYNHTWDDDASLCPFEYAYYAMDRFLDVLGPNLRHMGVIRLGDDPFWAARSWMTIKGLSIDEYNYLFAKAWAKYAGTFGERVVKGSLVPGGRAITRTAAPGGAA